MNDLPLRPNVCLLILNLERKLFLGERSGQSGVWQFPQGGLDEAEDAANAAIREASEELGADSKLFKVIQKLEARHEYDFINPPEYALGKWRGQSQTFWLLQFTGSDSDIDLARHVPEFQSYRWSSVQEIRVIAEPRRLPGYEKVLPEVLSYLSKTAS